MRLPYRSFRLTTGAKHPQTSMQVKRCPRRHDGATRCGGRHAWHAWVWWMWWMSLEALTDVRDPKPRGQINSAIALVRRRLLSPNCQFLTADGRVRLRAWVFALACP